MGGVGSGSKPKQYPEELVQRVKALYESGLTQCEVAERCALTQKIVWKLMLRHQIQTRPQIKRNQRGPKNSSWKGSDAGYAALHLRVQTARGTPSRCEDCGTASAKRYEWANLTRKYDDPNDYRRLCTSCHHKLDGTAMNFKSNRKEVPNA